MKPETIEFMDTYGWAILVVLAIIFALAYFGILTPENLRPVAVNITERQEYQECIKLWCGG